MSVVGFCGGRFCRLEETARQTADRLGCTLYTDQDLAAKAAGLGPLSEGKLLAAMYERPGTLGGFSKLRSRAVPQLGLAMAELLTQDPAVFLGLGLHLVSPGVTHLLSVCLTADNDFRVAVAAAEEGLGARQARELIRRSDQAFRRWREFLLQPGDWRAYDYDMVLPLGHKDMENVLDLILDAAASEPLRPTAGSLTAVEDMALWARAQAGLALRGFYHPQFKTQVHRGRVTVEINKKILRLGKLTTALKTAVRQATGVETVETKMGPGYHRSDVYRQHTFVLPSKILLVDEQRDFVETLSERLRLRDMGVSVVYDAEQALEAIAAHEPRVVALDLRIPGVIGMEVLKKIKAHHPGVKVIVLTGHGSARDRSKCLKQGAFAFLQKPVEPDELTEVVRQAMEP